MRIRDRKVFSPDELAGASTAYWEDVWSRVDLAAVEAGQRRHPDPAMRLLLRHVPETGRVLEAGSGASTYAAALRSPGRTVVGVDLAERALRRAADAWPDLLVVQGDVRDLPFADGSFDAVVSLGVVEHLEAGPERSLAEHARILAPGGLLLISVPWISAVKAVRDHWYLGVRRQASHPARGRLVTEARSVGVAPGPGRFHQYEFSTRTWDRYLAAAGLEVLWDHRYWVNTGIGEVRSGAPSRHAPTSGGSGSAPPSRRGARSAVVDVVRRSVIHELPSGPLERALAAVGQRAFAHMRMTVARRRT